jgi:hypothetical protein
MSSVTIRPADNILRQFSNQINALGEGKARPALARSVNRVTSMARTRVIREVTRQSSIPRAMVAQAVKRRLARVNHAGPLEGVIWATGKPISLKYFRARQFSFGVKARVQGQWRRYPGTFMGPRPGSIAPKLGGHVFARTSAARLPIEMIFGPSVPEELVRGEARKAFEELVASHLPQRVRHELGRLLP